MRQPQGVLSSPVRIIKSADVDIVFEYPQRNVKVGFFIIPPYGRAEGGRQMYNTTHRKIEMEAPTETGPSKTCGKVLTQKDS